MPKPPTLVLAIDQGEELFLAEAQGEAQPFLALLRDLLVTDNPAVIAVFTIRSDNYERLQQAQELADIHKVPFDLGPMPKGSYAEVVKGPIRRLDGTARASQDRRQARRRDARRHRGGRRQGCAAAARVHAGAALRGIRRHWPPGTRSLCQTRPRQGLDRGRG